MNCLGPRAGRPRAQEETMKIVQTDEIPLKRGLEHRGGIGGSAPMAGPVS